MSEPIKQVNGNGQVRWQPYADGELLWRTTAGAHWSFFSSNYGGLGPKLYRSYKRAKRIGDRRLRWIAKREWAQDES